MIGRERIAIALATGTIQTLGISDTHKAEAIEWVREQDAERAMAGIASAGGMLSVIAAAVMLGAMAVHKRLAGRPF